MAAERFCAQPGGVEVAIGEAEIVVSFPAADRYGDLAAPCDVSVDLDAPSARHLAQLLLSAAPNEEEEMRDITESHDVTLDRSGDRQLKFRGRRVGAASSRQQSGSLQNRWHELAIYRTDRGRYVVAVAYRTSWQGESSRDYAEPIATAQAAASCLREYDPRADVAGYPAGPQYAERQRRLLSEIEVGYESAVSRALAGDEFAEALE